MASLESKTGFDSDYSVGSFIPTGAIVMVGGSAYTTNQLNNIEANGICPCDGRALNTYTYRNLHSIVSNIYGGTAYSAGVTNISTATTTFNVPILNDSLYYIAMPSDSTLPKSTAGSNTHTHTTTTNATGTTTSGSFPHGHTTYHAYNSDGDHGVGHGAAWVGVNATSAHNAAVFKNDGSCAGAAINHSHTSIYREYVAGNSGNHSHGVNAFVGDASDTAHTHDYTTSSTLANSTVTPPYVASLFFIKL